MESDFTKSLSESKDDDHIHLLQQDFDEGMASKMLPIDPPGTTLLNPLMQQSDIIVEESLSVKIAAGK